MSRSLPGFRAFRLLGVLLIASLSMYCGEDCNNDDPLGIRPFMYTVPSGPIGMLEGGVITIEVVTENVSSPNITFNSTSSGVASVSSTGTVTALSEGSTTIQVRETTEDLARDVVVNVVGFDGAAVILDATLSPAYSAGDTIALSRITHGRPADPDACVHVHLHTEFGQAGILIDTSNGPFTDPNPGVCGFGRIIALSSGAPIAPVGQGGHEH